MWDSGVRLQGRGFTFICYLLCWLPGWTKINRLRLKCATATRSTTQQKHHRAARGSFQQEAGEKQQEASYSRSKKKQQAARGHGGLPAWRWRHHIVAHHCNCDCRGTCAQYVRSRIMMLLLHQNIKIEGSVMASYHSWKQALSLVKCRHRLLVGDLRSRPCNHTADVCKNNMLMLHCSYFSTLNRRAMFCRSCVAQQNLCTLL